MRKATVCALTFFKLSSVVFFTHFETPLTKTSKRTGEEILSDAFIKRSARK